MKKKKLDLDLKSALKIGLVFYVGTFGLGILWTLFLNGFWFLGALGSVILVCLGTAWYFRSTSIKPSARAGLIFGILVVLLGFFLDSVVLVPLVLIGRQDVSSIVTYYSNPLYGATLLLVLLSSAGTGFFLSHYKKH